MQTTSNLTETTIRTITNVSGGEPTETLQTQLIKEILGDLLSRYVDLLDEGGHGGWSLNEDATARRAFIALKNADAAQFVDPLARRSLGHHLTLR